MQLRNKDKTNLVKVGFFVGGLALILCIMVVSIGKENSVFKPKVDIRAHVGNVSALKSGSYVELKGIRIGDVTEIKIISDEEVEIVMTVLKEAVQWMKTDSKVSISTAGLVGDKFVEIYGGSKEAASFDYEKDILRSEAGIDFKQIMTKGDTIASITERILVKVDGMMTGLDNGNKIVSTMDSLNKAASHLETSMADLNKAQFSSTFKNVNETMKRLDNASASLERILARIEKGPGSANSIIYDDSLHEDLRTLLGGAERNKVIKYFIRESIRSSEQKKKN